MANRKRLHIPVRFVLAATSLAVASGTVFLFLFRDLLTEQWAAWSLRQLGYEVALSTSEFDEPETILGKAKYLRIVGHRQIDEVALGLLVRCRALRTLELDVDAVQPGILHRLGQLPCLRAIAIAGAHIDDASLNGIQFSTGIERFTIQHTAIQGEALRHLSSLGAIRELWLNDNPRLGDFRSVDLSHLRNVESINLSRTAIVGDCLAWLPNCNDLYLDHTLSDDETVQGLTRCDRLQKLWLVGTRVTGKGFKILASLPFLAELNLSECPISDESLRKIRELRHLESLTLAWTLITDTGVGHLCSATQLRFVGLSFCPRVTAAGVARLRDSLNSAQANSPRESEVWVDWDGTDDTPGATLRRQPKFASSCLKLVGYGSL